VGVDLTIEPATVALAMGMAPMMREADVAEVRAAGNLSPQEALEASVRWSSQSYAARFDGELACIFGVGYASFLSGVGIPWLLGTSLLLRYPHAFHRASQAFVAAWLEEFTSLEQMVDVRNVRSLRWLRHLGFTVDAPRLWGYERRPFCRVHIERGN
jgi:hypothetical protein